jgi:hypothetical protein
MKTLILKALWIVSVLVIFHPVPGWSSWSGWTSLGKPSTAGIQWPVVGQNQDGRLEVFAHTDEGGVNYKMVHIPQISPNGAWGSWVDLGLSGGLAAAAVIRNQDGRLEVFGQQLYVGFGYPPYSGIHTAISHISQTAANNGWGAWSDLYQPEIPLDLIDLWDPYVGQNLDGRLVVFAVGQGLDGNLWKKSQSSPGIFPTGSTGWTNLGRPAGTYISPVLSVGRNQDGRLEVFTQGANCEIYHRWMSAVNNDNSWSAWDSFGKPGGVGCVDNPAVAINQDGRLEFFTRGSDGAFWHRWQLAPNFFWSGWGSLGSPPGGLLSDPVVGRYQDGRLDVFALGNDLAIWHIWQTAPSNGWSNWESLGKPAGVNLTAQLAVGRNQDGRLSALAVGADGALWIVSQQVDFIIITCYALTTNVGPAGAGQVTSAPSPGCFLGTTYSEGTAVTLTAVPNSGYTFLNWSGDVSGNTNPVNVTMNGNKTVTANFTGSPLCYPLKAEVSPAGSGLLAANPSPGCNNGTQYAAGTAVTLTATANGGFSFLAWSGAAAGSANPTTLTMSGDKNVTANFLKLYYLPLLFRNP